MKLNEAIQKIVSDNGVEILKERRLVALLSDYKAFDGMQYAKNILKQVYADNFGEQILEVYQSNDITKANALISNLSDNLGYDEDKLSEIFSGFFPEMIAGNDEEYADDDDDSEYDDDDDAEYDDDDDSEYDDDDAEYDVSESDAENAEFVKLRDRMMKFYQVFPEQWRILKRAGQGYEIQQLKQMFVDFNSEYELNVSTHRYTNWQFDVLDKLKQNLDLLEREVDSKLTAIYNYEKQEEQKEYNKRLSEAIRESEGILTSSTSKRFATGSSNFFAIKWQIDRNTSILNNNYPDNDNIKKLANLQTQLLRLKEQIETFSVMLPTSTRIIFIFLVLLYNYLAFITGWGWLFLTIPLSLTYYALCVENKLPKVVHIGGFIALSVIILTIIAPFPWWTVIVALIASGIYIYMNRECTIE